MTAPPVYLVTGATGFIGQALCRELKTGGKGCVRSLLRREVDGPWDEHVRADVAGTAPLDDALDGVDTVFHLAGKAHATDELRGDENEYRKVDVDGTRRLLDAAAASGAARFVYFSSVKAMGEEGGSDEDEPKPQTVYGRSKLAAEKLVLGDRRIPHTTVLRLSLVYGPGVKGNLHRMMKGVDRGFFPPVPRVSNGRSMVHVEDVARAAVLAAEHDAANRRVFVLTDGRPYSTREIYEWICGAMGKPVPRWTLPLPVLRTAARIGDGAARVLGRRFLFDSDAFTKLFGSARYDSTSIERTLGFQPKWNLESALPEIVADFRRRNHWQHRG